MKKRLAIIADLPTLEVTTDAEAVTKAIVADLTADKMLQVGGDATTGRGLIVVHPAKAEGE